MIIQHFVLPKDELHGHEHLYIRERAGRLLDETRLTRSRVLSFDTYFNSLALGKWACYTSARRFRFEAEIAGTCTVRIKHRPLKALLANRGYASDIDSADTVLAETHCAHEQSRPVSLDFSAPEEAFLAFLEIEHAADSQITLHRACFHAGKDVPLNPFKLAILITTYQREEFVKRNIAAIQRAIGDCADLAGSLHIYVTDNASSLSLDPALASNVTIISNPNLGGSGGFARGLIELGRVQDNQHYSHVLFMDDDVLLHPETIYRTYALLRMLGEEHRESIVSGSMLRFDAKNKAHALVEQLCENGHSRQLIGHIDLSAPASVLMAALTLKPERHYSAWWYTILPASVIDSGQFPFPFFCKADDQDFCLRLKKPVIILNGICVWHMSFDSKHSDATSYLSFRNFCALNSIHYSRWKWNIMRILFLRIISLVAMNNYHGGQVLLDALEDFLNGMKTFDGHAHDFLKNHSSRDRVWHNINDNHEVARAYLAQGTFSSVSFRKISLPRKLLFLTSLGGLLIPKRLMNASRACGINRPNLTYFPSRTMYAVNSFAGTYLALQHDKRKLARLLARLARLIFRCAMTFKAVQREFAGNYTNLTNHEFWSRYIDSACDEELAGREKPDCPDSQGDRDGQADRGLVPPWRAAP